VVDSVNEENQLSELRGMLNRIRLHAAAHPIYQGTL
jgi:hypothetical protein